MTEIETHASTIREVSLADITVPDKRMRQKMRDPSRLAESMREVGLLHPIAITEDEVLVAGLHRLRAAGLLGWKSIEARVVGGGELDAELAEIDENLISNHLTRAEEARHIARREQIMQAKGERAAASPGTNQYGEVPATVAGTSPKTTKQLAEEAGMSERTYQQRAKIGQKLTDETLEIISELDPNDADLPNSTRQLNYLAGVDDPEDQAEIARRVATGEAVSVWNASEQMKGERQEEKEEADELRIVALERAATMEIVVRWSDNTKNVVPKKRVLQEARFTQCKCCRGLGIVDKEAKKAK